MRDANVQDSNSPLRPLESCTDAFISKINDKVKSHLILLILLVLLLLVLLLLLLLVLLLLFTRHQQCKYHKKNCQRHPISKTGTKEINHHQMNEVNVKFNIFSVNKTNSNFKRQIEMNKTATASPMNMNNNNNNNNNNSPNPTKTGSSTTGTRALDDPNVYHWICQLTYGPQREQALLELGRKREQYDDLAIVLWNSFGVMTSLLQEIISIYPFLNPPNLLTNQLSNRVCNALVLLQCVASHKDSKFQFIRSQLPFYLFPFLSTTNKSRSFEYLRLTSLGVIGALVKNDSKEVVQFLLKTDIIPLCLRIMESSTELSKTVAIFILQKIIMDDNGLQYICSTQERFMAVSNVLNHMVEHILNTPTGAAATAIGVSNATGNAPGTATNNTPAGQDTPSTTPPARLLKHIVRCYLRLSDNLEARQLLKHVLPRSFVENTTVVGNVNGNGVSIAEILNDDVNTNKCLNQLLNTLEE